MKSLWGDWLPKIMDEFDKAEPTKEERLILEQAEIIRKEHKLRLKAIVDKINLTQQMQ